MPLPSLSVVRLTTNAYRDRGLAAGDVGTILEVYDDKYEIDFSRPDTGETIAWFALPQSDVEPIAEPNAVHVASPADTDTRAQPGVDVIDLAPLTDAELLTLWANAMRELKCRGVIRSANNPVADYAERLVADQLGLTLAPPLTPGYDAIGPDKTRYQIKARRSVSGPKRQLGAIRNLDQGGFDYLVVVLFDEVFRVEGMWRFPIDLVRDHAVYRERVNAHILRLTDAVLIDPRAERLV